MTQTLHPKPKWLNNRFLLPDSIALSQSQKLLDSKPCFGKQTSKTSLIEEECWVCPLLDRCRAFSGLIDYNGVFECPTCKSKNSGINIKIIKLKIVGFIEAQIQCPECKIVESKRFFLGKEQKTRCSHFGNMYTKNLGCDGSHGNPYVLDARCRRCSTSKFLECIKIAVT